MRPPLRGAAASIGAVVVAAVLIAGLLALRAALTADPLDRLAARPDGDRVRHAGSWHLPRGGPYVLGFESPGPAELSIDGAPVARGAGVVSERRVFAAGAHAVELVAPPGARLLWEPVGRRGPAEYVSPSSLALGAPAAARFEAPGTARLDGAIALAALLVLAALAGFLARGWLAAIDRATAGLAASVFVAALAVRLVDLGGAGQTWDEDTCWSAGRNYVTNLLGRDFAPASWRFNLEHPPVTKYLAGIGAQLADGYGPARATSAIVLALACALLVPIGRRLGGRRAGLLAGLAAALTPHLIAHGKIVGHEAPTALLWTAAALLALAAFERLPPAGPGVTPTLVGRFAALGVVLGLAVSTRFVNGLLAALIGAILVIQAPAGLRRRTVAVGLAVIPAVALATAVAIWPRLWSAPLDHLAEAWRILRRPHGAEPFLGALTRQPGAGYFPLYLVATAPLGVLAAAAGYLAAAARRPDRGALVVVLWLVIPLAVGLSPVRQDGVRYLVPSLVALALMAGLGLDRALGAIGRAARRASPSWIRRLVSGAPRPPPGRDETSAPPPPDRDAASAPDAAAASDLERRLGLAGAALLAVYLGATDLAIHPYYLDFYGEQVGGPATVARRRWFETAWWGEGLAEALAHLNRAAPAGARVHKACVEPGHLAWLRADLWAGEVRRADQADWILVYAPLTHPCPLPADAVLVHEVAIRGAPLARVYRRPPR